MSKTDMNVKIDVLLSEIHLAEKDKRMGRITKGMYLETTKRLIFLLDILLDSQSDEVKDRVRRIRSGIDKGEYETAEKIAATVKEVQRELYGCSSRRTLESGLAVVVCVAVFLGLLIAVVVLKACGL
jgi:hypothetical protein